MTLLPCPFCGSEDLDTSEPYVKCNSCLTYGPSPHFGAWNTRVDSPEIKTLKARVAALELVNDAWAKGEK